jgi:hypothetical protein
MTFGPNLMFLNQRFQFMRQLPDNPHLTVGHGAHNEMIKLDEDSKGGVYILFQGIIPTFTVRI